MRSTFADIVQKRGLFDLRIIENITKKLFLPPFII